MSNIFVCIFFAFFLNNDKKKMKKKKCKRSPIRDTRLRHRYRIYEFDFCLLIKKKKYVRLKRWITSVECQVSAPKRFYIGQFPMFRMKQQTFTDFESISPGRFPFFYPNIFVFVGNLFKN